MYVFCVVSFHPFWTSSSLDVPAGVTQEEGHTGFLIHLPSAVRALIFIARRIQPFLSLVDREVEIRHVCMCGIHILNRHTTSGQCRVYCVTQLRTDGVHCRESVGTEPVVPKVVRVTAAAFASPWTKCYYAPLFPPLPVYKRVYAECIKILVLL